MSLNGGRPDVPNAIGTKTLLEAARRINGTFKSTTVDASKLQGRGIVRLTSSLGVGTTPTLTPTLEHSDTDVDGNFVAVPAALVTNEAGDTAALAVVTSAANNGTQKVCVDLSGIKRYFRFKAVVAAAAGQGFDFAAVMEAAPRPNVPQTTL